MVMKGIVLKRNEEKKEGRKDLDLFRWRLTRAILLATK